MPVRKPIPRPLRRVAGLLLTVLLPVAGGACGGGGPAHVGATVSDVVATVSDQVNTVVIVTWSTDTPSKGFVEFGPTRDLGMKTPVDWIESTDHRAVLVGSPADADVFFRAVVVNEDGSTGASSAVDTIHTGILPVGLPALSVEAPDPGNSFDGYVVVPVLGSTRAVTIINGKGEIVWYHADDRMLDFYRARLGRDGTGVIYNAAQIAGEPSAAAELVRVSFDGSQTSAISVPFLAHDFVELPDGTLGAIAFEDRDVNGERVRGNKLVEIAPDGTQSTIWTSWDCFDPATTPGDDPQQGWTFANALDYDATTETYYVGMRNFSSIAKIPRATGTCEWVVGLYGSTFTFAPGAGRFLHEHQFHVFGDHILVMDNDGAPGNVSRLLEYQLDTSTMVATQVWTYTSNPSVYTFVLGEPLRLADGGTFVNWSTAGQMERLDASGNLMWKLNTSAGFVFGFQTLASSPYQAGGMTVAGSN